MFGILIRIFNRPVIFFTLALGIMPSFSASANERQFLLNKQIDPCQNFYQYVCSKEIESFKRPSHRSRYTFVYADAYENFLPKVNSFLDNLSSDKDSSAHTVQIRNFYNSCLNKKARIEEENIFLKKWIKEVQELKTREAFLKYTADSVHSGDLTWISFDNAALLSDPKKWRIQIYVYWTTLPEKSYYQNQELMKDFTSLVVNLLKAVKIDNALERAQRIVDLEKKIAESEPTSKEYHGLWDKNEYWSRNEFIKKYPQLSRQIGADNFSKKVPIHQYTVPLYDMVEKVLLETDLEVLKDFLLVRTLISKLDFSQPEWSAQYWDFKNKRLGGPAQRRPLPQECSRFLQDKLGSQLASKMVKTFFNDYPRKEFTELVESLRSTLIQRIKENPWLTPQGRKNTLKKMKALNMALLHPEKEEDWRFLKIEALHPDRFLENLKIISLAYDARTLSETKSSRNTNAWSVSPLEFDAYYTRAQNRFYFPAAFALKPIYDVDADKIKNLGGIGTLIAHELGHALDKYGSQFNEFGAKESILKKKDQEKFDKFGKMFIEQFNQIGHNGELTLAENIADHVGLMTAFQTAFSKKKDIEQQKKFFISYAHNWCTDMSEEYKASHLKEDTHALPEARVNEQIKHVAEFAETFQCAPDSKMVLPADKRVQIW